MLIRNAQDQVEAAAKDDLDKSKYTWHIYTAARGTKFKGAKGEASLKKGDYFGVKEHTSKEDKILILNAPTLVFRLAIPKSDTLMNDKAKECRGGKLPKAAMPKAEAPKKVKIKVDEKPAPKAAPKTPKAKPAAEAKPAKVKPTANQKAIAALKDEIKRIKTLKQNPANLRKIAKLNEELKKRKAKEKIAAPKEAKVSTPPKQKKEVVENYSGAGAITFSRLGSGILTAFIDGNEVLRAEQLGGPKARFIIKHSLIGTKGALIDGRIKKVEAQLTKELTTYVKKLKSGSVKSPFLRSTVEAPARVKEASKPVDPVKEAKRTEKKPTPAPKAAAPKAANVKLATEYEEARKLLKAIDKGGVPLNPVKLNNIGRALGLDIARSAKPADTVERIRAAVQRAIESAQAEQKHAAPAPKKVKIAITPSDDDDDDDVPHGHVRYGGSLIEPDELEFDDDVKGLVNLPVDESWSADKPELNLDEVDSEFKHSRPH